MSPFSIGFETAPAASATLEVDFSALADNWRTLRNAARGAECAAAVKADGYGLGLEQVGATLSEAGARTFFVAVLSEGLRLRKVLPDATIYILGGLPPGASSLLSEARLRPVLGSRPELDEWAAFARVWADVPPAAIHVDTGMNRLGFRLEEALALAAEKEPFGGLHPALLMSHLACADTPDHPLTTRQHEAFSALKTACPNIPASLANSAATLSGPKFHYDLVRPGIALYGAEAIAGRPPLQTVVTLRAPVIQVRDMPAGETVGYGATFTASRPIRVAVLCLGYADGYIRAAGATASHPGAEAAFDGKRYRLVGRVSMDLIAIDVTDAPQIGRGSMVELFGPTVPIDEVARSAGTIGYELLTRLGNRFRRTERHGV